MKMEVLTVQNQFQNQFVSHLGGGGDTNKVKDWTAPLTLPPSTTIKSKSNSHYNNHHHHHHHHHNRNHSQQSDELLLQTDLSSQHEDSLEALSLRLQDELRLAKSRHLACTEVLLPADLLNRVASEMFRMSEKEPCGIRGCNVFIEFEDEPSNTRRIASLKTDPSTVSTFELYLTLKQDRSGWTSILPQFLKNLARGSTIMISPDFQLTKNKLYRSFAE